MKVCTLFFCMSFICSEEVQNTIDCCLCHSCLKLKIVISPRDERECYSIVPSISRLHSERIAVNRQLVEHSGKNTSFGLWKYPRTSIRTSIHDTLSRGKCNKSEHIVPRGHNKSLSTASLSAALMPRLHFLHITPVASVTERFSWRYGIPILRHLLYVKQRTSTVCLLHFEIDVTCFLHF